MKLIECFDWKFEFELFPMYRRVLEIVDDFYWQDPNPFAPPNTYTDEADIEQYWVPLYEGGPTEVEVEEYNSYWNGLFQEGWTHNPVDCPENVYWCAIEKMNEFFAPMAASHEYVDLPMRICRDDKFWFVSVENLGTAIRFGTEWQHLQCTWRCEEKIYHAYIRLKPKYKTSLIPSLTALALLGGMLGLGSGWAQPRIKI